MIEQGAIGVEGILRRLGWEEFLEWDQQVGLLMGPAPVGGSHAVVFGTLDEAGAQGIEFAVEEGGLEAFRVE